MAASSSADASSLIERLSIPTSFRSVPAGGTPGNNSEASGGEPSPEIPSREDESPFAVIDRLVAEVTRLGAALNAERRSREELSQFMARNLDERRELATELKAAKLQNEQLVEVVNNMAVQLQEIQKDNARLQQQLLEHPPPPPEPSSDSLRVMLERTATIQLRHQEFMAEQHAARVAREMAASEASTSASPTAIKGADVKELPKLVDQRLLLPQRIV